MSHKALFALDPRIQDFDPFYRPDFGPNLAICVPKYLQNTMKHNKILVPGVCFSYIKQFKDILDGLSSDLLTKK